MFVGGEDCVVAEIKEAHGTKDFCRIIVVHFFFSVFVKFLLMSSHVEVKEKRENGLLIIQTFKEDWAMA